MTPRAAPPGPPGASERTQGRLVAGAGVALLLFLLWRVRHGADFGDGSYVVALAVRVARGAEPLSEELSAHVLGSLPAVPVAWAWLQLVGTEGVVAAVRTAYVLLAALAGTVAYRALRTRIAPAPAGFAVLAALLPTPYGLLVISYTTVPALSLLVAVSAAFAALRSSGRAATAWAVLSGAAAATAAVTHPALLGGALALCLTVAALAHRAGGPRVVVGLALGGGLVSVALAAWVLLGPGPGAVVEAATLNAADQEEYASAVERWRRTAVRYREALVGWRYLPLALGVAWATLTGLRLRGRHGPWRQHTLGLLLVLGWPVGVAVATLLGPAPRTTGATAASLALLLAAVLLVPVAAGPARVDPDLRLLLLLSAPVALVGGAGAAWSTKATAFWGPQLPPVLPLYAVVLLAVLVAVGRTGWGAGVRTAVPVTVLASLALVQSLLTFRDDAPWDMTERISAGPQAGLRTHACYADYDRSLRGVMQRWVPPDGTLLVHGKAAAYLYSTAEPVTPMLWTLRYGAASQAVVDHLRETGARPDAVLLERYALDLAGGWGSPPLATDPLVRFLGEHYGEPVPDAMFLVFTTDPPAVVPPGVQPDAPSC